MTRAARESTALPSDPRSAPAAAESASFRTVQDYLGLHLRQLYAAEEAKEGGGAVPQRLIMLIGRLERVLGASDGQATVEPELRDELLAALSSLRAFAISLCGDRERADDLVQETILKAWKNIARFERGTNLQAWLFTILRNHFLSEWRKRSREVEDPDETYAGRLAVLPEQGGKLDLCDLRAALQHLSPEQREALLLVAAEGLSYEEAAQVMDVAVGTIKSRVNRARSRLVELLGIEHGGDFGADGVTRAAMSGT